MAEAKVSKVGVEVGNGISDIHGHNNEDADTVEEHKKAEETNNFSSENESESSKEEQTFQNLVFYANAEGVDPSPTCGSGCTGEKMVADSEVEEIDTSFPRSDVQSAVSPAAANEGAFDKEVSPHSNLHSSKNSSPGINEGLEFPTEIAPEEGELISELDDAEETEYDVETVIQKQRTHDLYCPNCNSCITRRVILRRRKRIVHVSDQEAKRNKTEVPIDMKTSSPSFEAVESRVQQTDEVSHDHTQEPDDDEHHERADVFRCLSCFSFFLPNGHIFQFKIFGDRNATETGREVHSTRKHWFSPAFPSGMQQTSAHQGIRIHQDQQTASSETKESNDSSKRVNIRAPDSTTTSTTIALLDANVSNEFEESKSSNLLASTLPHRNSVLEEDIGKFGSSFHGSQVTSEGSLTPKTTGHQMPSSATLGAGQLFQFKIFGDRNKKDTGREEQVRTIREHWFSSTFPSDKQQTSADQGIRNHQDQQTASSETNESLDSSDRVDFKAPYSTSTSNIALRDANISYEYKGSKSSNLLASTLPIRNSVLEEDYGSQVFTSKEGSLAPKRTGQGQAPSSATFGAGDICTSEVTRPTIISSTKIEVDTSYLSKTHSVSTLTGAHGKDALITIDRKPTDSFQSFQDTTFPSETADVLQSTIQTGVTSQETTETLGEFAIEVIKSIVYGGLAESLTSLSVVSSAAGGGATTLNVLALGAANVIGGLFVIFHNLWELRHDRSEQILHQVSNHATNERGRYNELLGLRKNFVIHVIFVVLSYIIFGLVPPVVYGFSFLETNDKELKFIVLGIASLLCILLISIGHAYVKMTPKPYFKSIATFVILGFAVSGMSYGAGILINRFLENLGLFASGEVPGLFLQEMRPSNSAVTF